MVFQQKLFLHMNFEHAEGAAKGDLLLRRYMLLPAEDEKAVMAERLSNGVDRRRIGRAGEIETRDLRCEERM